MPHRFTISLAQLLLLAMLSALFCTWLPEAVRLNGESLVEIPKRLKSILSLDCTVLYSRAGQHGVAAFETTSGKCLFTKSLARFEEPVFDPAAKQIAVLNRSQRASYEIRVFSLVTGQSRHVTSPPSKAGYEMDIHPLISKSIPLLRGDRVYDFPTRYPPALTLASSEECLRCWNLASNQESFCHELGHLELYFADPSFERIAYYAYTTKGTGLDRTFHHQLQVRDLSTGKLLYENDLDLSGEVIIPQCYAHCHKSQNLAIRTSNHLGYHQLREIHGSDIFLTTSEGKIKKILAIDGLDISQIALEQTDETVWHLGIRDNGLQILARRNIEHGYNIRTYDVGHLKSARVMDFKLLPGEKQVALAADDGSFRVLDVESGKEVRRLTGLKYVPSYRQLFILVSVSGVWLVLWWLATRPRANTPPRLVRLLGYAVFLAGFAQGLFLLGICDQPAHRHEPTTVVAVVFPSLLALIGCALLLDARCHKPILLYGIIACMGMIAYTVWIPG